MRSLDVRFKAFCYSGLRSPRELSCSRLFTRWLHLITTVNTKVCEDGWNGWVYTTLSLKNSITNFEEFSLVDSLYPGLTYKLLFISTVRSHKESPSR